eukprot:7852922-Pyramimonas_sp.AAC.1
MRWDPFHQAVFVEVPQIKTSKVKLVAFTAGAHRHNDFFLDFADYFALRSTKQLNTPGYDNANWLLPELLTTNSPRKVMGAYVNALLPVSKGGAQKYAEFA